MNDNIEQDLLENKKSKILEQKTIENLTKNKNLSVSSQTWLLILKNLRIFKRNKGFFIFHLLLALGIFCWISLMNYLFKNQSALSKLTTFPPTSSLPFSKCGDSTLDPSSGCLTLGVVIVDQAPQATPVQDWIQKALYTVKTKFGLEDNKDVQLIYSGSDMEALYDRIESFSKIKNIVSFCNNYDFFHNDTISVNCHQAEYSPFEMDINIYAVHFNYTSLMPSQLLNLNNPVSNDINAILLKQTIDEAILNFYDEQPQTHSFDLPYKPATQCSRVVPQATASSGQKLLRFTESPQKPVADESGFSFEFNLMNFPAPPNRLISRFDASTQWGSFFYIFMILLSFNKFGQLISKEKDAHLRRGLVPLGLNHFAYWLSWLICICAFDVLFTLFFGLLGMIFGVPLFAEINLFIPFLVILLCFWSFRFLSVLITCLSHDYRSASKAYYLVMIISIFLQGKANCSVLLLERGFLVVFPDLSPVDC